MKDELSTARRYRPRDRHYREAFLFLSPWLIGFALFQAYPILYSLYLSFCKWDMLSPAPDWVGLHNYARIVGDDPRFMKSLWVTTLYAAGSVPLSLTAALLLAGLLNQRWRGIGVFRTIYYLPAVVSGVAVSILWMGLLNPEQGLINQAIGWFYNLFGISHDYLPGWLFSTRWALPGLIVMSLWGIGPACVIFLAGLQAIPQELHEAARIDGAGRARRWLAIDLPLLSPMILFNLIMGLIASFQVFTQGYVMTGGGPRNATLFFVLYIWQRAFIDFNAGYASALAWILFSIILALTLLVLSTSRRWVYYAGEKGGS